MRWRGWCRRAKLSPRGFLAKGKKLAYTFKKKGNEIQSTLIDRVTERVVLAAAHVERAMAADESGAVHLTKAREDLEEGIKILTHRQKMIKFADRSDAGRALVEEYEYDALASNPEDERKMEKAERAAEKKVAKKRKLRESKTREEAVKMGALRPSIEPGMAFAPTKPPMAPKLIGGMVPRPSGSCFHCGGPGHFGRECPKALASVPYPLPNVREHMAGESLCFRGEVVETVTHGGGVECGKELTPDIVACEGEGGSGRCWEVQEGEAGTISVRGRSCNCLVHGTLVVPCWESASFCTLLWSEGEGWAPFIVDTRSLPLSEWLVRPGRSGEQLFKGKLGTITSGHSKLCKTLSNLVSFSTSY